MKRPTKSALVGLLVAACVAASGSSASANLSETVLTESETPGVGEVARGHGETISALARSTPGGPGKGAIISAAAKTHGKTVSDAARTQGEERRASQDDGASDAGRDSAADGRARGESKAAGAADRGEETSTAARADGRAFGEAQATAGKARRGGR